MNYYANYGKSIDITVNGTRFKRHAVRTGYIEIGDSYMELIEKFIIPIYKPGDLVLSAEKILSICSSNVIYPKDMKIGKWAIFLSSKVEKTSAGFGLSLPLKMQYAIDTVGLPRILFAAAVSLIGKKVFRRKGWFYVVAGKKVTGIDGFGDAGQDANNMIGIPLPDNAQETCDNVLKKFGIDLVITDTNDFSTMTLAMPKSVKKKYSKKDIDKFVKDNPYGQHEEYTPFILIRKDS